MPSSYYDVMSVVNSETLCAFLFGICRAKKLTGKKHKVLGLHILEKKRRKQRMESGEPAGPISRESAKVIAQKRLFSVR